MNGSEPRLWHCEDGGIGVNTVVSLWWRNSKILRRSRFTNMLMHHRAEWKRHSRRHLARAFPRPSW